MPKYQRTDWPQNWKAYAKTCEDCGMDFFSNRPQTKFCSTTCRVHNFQKRVDQFMESNVGQGPWWDQKPESFSKEPVRLKEGYLPARLKVGKSYYTAVGFYRQRNQAEDRLFRLRVAGLKSGVIQAYFDGRGIIKYAVLVKSLEWRKENWAE